MKLSSISVNMFQSIQSNKIYLKLTQWRIEEQRIRIRKQETKEIQSKN
jgi:hypothetical protein